MNEPSISGPLAGLRVACIAVYVPALSAAQRLRASGAEVVAVEPAHGDPLESLAPSWYRRLHEGVTTRRLDLKSPDGAREIGALLQGTDVLFIALRPSAAKRLGLDWATLHASYPRLCVVAITGHAPPHAEVPGHDLTYQAARGLVAPPTVPRTVLADLAGAERAAYAAATLLFARERSGLGGHQDVSLEEALAPFAEPLELGVTGSAGPLGGALPSYAVYAAADGWIAVAALEPHFWRRLCDALGADGADLDGAALARAFAEDSVAHWVQWAHERDLPLAAVR